MPEVSFSTTRNEDEVIRRILDRAIELNIIEHAERTNLSMDLSATHCNGCPMCFEALETATDFDFLHDLSGIQAHLNRNTGNLKDHFLPRYSVRRLRG